MIELNEEQRRAVKAGGAVHVAAPESGEDLVLLRASLYERLCELVDNE